MSEVIPLVQCKDRVLYHLLPWNLHLAVFDAASGRFAGIRTKGSHRRIDFEPHRDQGPPYGTGFPIRELPERLPDDIPLERGSSALFEWLQQMESKYLPEEFASSDLDV